MIRTTTLLAVVGMGVAGGTSGLDDGGVIQVSASAEQWWMSLRAKSAEVVDDGLECDFDQPPTASATPTVLSPDEIDILAYPDGGAKPTREWCWWALLLSPGPIERPVPPSNGNISQFCTILNDESDDGIATVALAGPIVILFFDTAVMGMAIWAIRRKYHVHDRSNPLLMKIRQDTITYFCNNFLVAVVSVIVFLTNVGQAVVSLRIASVLTSTLASTMILDLKDYGNCTFSFSQDLAAAYSVSELSTLRFDARGSSQIDE
ncbi:hypothetical protein P691DRAFT_765258 [Macrolepiota fuliginosa MF-IS2]|uniref:CSC1/OSCA1-like 7TM region domain-containing protein n=1 Tax=Macrolepiota fuliginosa MF-IS2 TaxID=1400762 RepID=A0A9P6BW18_9AGAR|nr:hypothetical protein P691DRAFT_765258 [Macrolepiota fuliginosa MF-IS2]